jgi:hypothetical protein
MYIDDLLILGDAQVALGILPSCVARQLSYLIWIIFHFSSFLFILANFDMRVMQDCGDTMSLGS